MKIYNFSQNKFLTKIQDAELEARFEVVENTGLSVEEVLSQKIDIIEIAPNDFDQFKEHVMAVDWKTSQLGMADCLILQKDSYRPMNLISAAIINLIKKNNKKINSQQPVIVIGEFHFAYSMAVQLALSGFIEIIISLTDANESYVELIEKKIKSFIFNLNIQIVNINELTTSNVTCALLISDFEKELNRDAYELLTYFNFLLPGAVFIDCNSINESSLVEDARKAEIAVIDESEVIAQKYNYLLEILKISSKV
ncbi:MAG: hypothetical protein ACXWQQ_03025 [Pseudobdellovibrio sp.]